MKQFHVHVYDLLVREFHLDTFGHVNNATYLQILEEARWQMISEQGYGLKKIQSTGLGPVILEVNLKFLKELRLRESIKIHTQVIDYEGKIGHLRQWIENQKSEICTEAKFTVGLFDTKDRKLVLPTDEWLNAVGLQ